MDPAAGLQPEDLVVNVSVQSVCVKFLKQTYLSASQQCIQHRYPVCILIGGSNVLGQILCKLITQLLLNA